MSEESQEQQGQDPANNAALRKQLEEAQAQIAELSAFKVNEVVRSVGLDPNQGNGLALKQLLGSDASEEKAQELVTQFGWQAAVSEKHEQTKEERAAMHAADSLSQLNSVTVSDKPLDLANQIADLDQQIVQARAQGVPSQQLIDQRIALTTKAALQAGPRA